MPDGSSEPGPTEVAPSYPPTEVDPPQAPPGMRRHGPGVATVSAVQPGSAPEHPAPEPTPQADGPPDVHRYGPGVPPTPPAGGAELTAERVWRADGPARRSRRWRRLARLSGSALTVILLAASGVLLYLRLHHGPLGVTGVAITQQAKNGCSVEVTGRVTTNGSAGTISYEWLFRSDPQSPQALDQSVEAGQHAVFVTVALQGQGHGSTSQMVTLQVLGAHPEAASAAVVVSCP